MHDRPKPLPFSIWIRRTALQLVLFALIPSLLGAAAVVRSTQPVAKLLDVSPTPAPSTSR